MIMHIEWWWNECIDRGGNNIFCCCWWRLGGCSQSADWSSHHRGSSCLIMSKYLQRIKQQPSLKGCAWNELHLSTSHYIDKKTGEQVLIKNKVVVSQTKHTTQHKMILFSKFNKQVTIKPTQLCATGKLCASSLYIAAWTRELFTERNVITM